MKNSKLKVDAAIFDLDGTLIDSTEAHFKVIEEIFTRMDQPVLPRKILLANMREKSENWGDLFPKESESRKKQLVKEAIELFREIYPRVFRETNRLIPGISDIIRRFSEEGIKIGLVTSTHLEFLNDKVHPLKEVGIFEKIESIIGIEDTPKFKPEPDPLIECARRMGVLIEKSVYIGDSYVDIRAGKAAGMKTVGVLTGMDDYETLLDEGPDVIIDSVSELNHIIDLS